jgi:uncharacterized membrane protein (DUF106 family)
MRNRKLRNIRPSAAFSPIVALTRSMLCAWEVFPRVFFLVVVQNVGWGVLYDVRVLYLAWLYMYRLCSISKDGICKSQMNEMVNLIPTCSL